MRKRLVWKTERLTKYTGRVADDTARTARELLVHGENVLQRKVRSYTPRASGRLYDSIETEHKGRFESVRRRSILGGGASYAMLPYVLEGSVYSLLSYASDVEYDTGIYNDRRGNKPITPTNKKALAFTTKGGKSIVVASVKGYPGKHMFAKGAAYIDESPTYLHNQSRPVLSRWRARNSFVRPR